MNDIKDSAFALLPKPNKKSFDAIFESYVIILENHLDPIREEICLCITHRLYQASILLTNHLLEKFLRDIVVLTVSGITNMNNPESQLKLDAEYKRREKASLYNLNEEGLKLKIINQNQFEQIKGFISNIRNPYSHGNANQILKDIKPMKSFNASFSGDIESEIYDTRVNANIALHGLFQSIKAEQDAPGYFKIVDDIIVDFYFNKNGGYYKRSFNGIA